MELLDGKRWEKINEIILGIYSGQDLYKMRINFLDGIRELVPHDKSFFDLGYKKETKVVFFDPATSTVDEDYMKDYFQVYESIDIMFWFFSQNNVDIYRESDYINPAMLESSVFYNEWMKPQNLRFSMGSRVAKNGIMYGSVNLWRSEDQGDFTDEELEVLRILNQHLAQYFYNKYPNGIRRNSEGDYSETLVHLYGLTSREAEIVEKIYEGFSSKEISEKLFISENTVKKHTHNIFLKMGVRSRSQVIRIVHGFSTTMSETVAQ